MNRDEALQSLDSERFVVYRRGEQFFRLSLRSSVQVQASVLAFLKRKGPTLQGTLYNHLGRKYMLDKHDFHSILQQMKTIKKEGHTWSLR